MLYVTFVYLTNTFDMQNKLDTLEKSCHTNFLTVDAETPTEEFLIKNCAKQHFLLDLPLLSLFLIFNVKGGH